MQGFNTARRGEIRGGSHDRLGILYQHLGFAPIHFLFVRALVVAMVALQRQWTFSSTAVILERIFWGTFRCTTATIGKRGRSDSAPPAVGCRVIKTGPKGSSTYFGYGTHVRMHFKAR